MDFLETLAVKVKAKQPVLVFPEGEDPIIQEAANSLVNQGLVRPILLGNVDTIRKSVKSISASALTILDPGSAPQLEYYIERYCKERDMPTVVGKRLMNQALFFAAMMVKNNEAGGMVAGITHPTEEVIMASELMIGLEPGVGLVSSFFVMHVPGFPGGEQGMLIFADPAVNPDPNPDELADIAISTAQSAKALLGWEPRVAMLSFSTKGSASHALVDKVIKATALANKKAPDLLIEGEMQADTALVPAVARKKITGESMVGGRANVLIFPDLNSANIGSKLVQRLTGAASYGPMLQGFAKPVSDLSRGATVKDVIGASLMVAARAGL